MIDWSQAPEGATHFNTAGTGPFQWYKVKGDDVTHWTTTGWEKSVFNDVVSHWIPRPVTVSTPTLETMLAEWRDLESRAQAAQAEADALFEHAGQCHGEIVVRLAELGWGAPRMVPGEPVVTLDDEWHIGTRLECISNDFLNGGDFTVGNIYEIVGIGGPADFPFRAKVDTDFTIWIDPNCFTPSAQP